MLTIRLDSPVPITEQIAAGIRCALAAGQLAVGDALPTVRQLAADLGVNLNTVARAYQALEAQGLVLTAGRRGTHVTATHMRREAAHETAAEVQARIASTLADAALAGVAREDLEVLVQAQLDAHFPTDSEAS